MNCTNISSAEKKNNNLLLSGTCACPGELIGRINVWRENKKVENGDIIILLDSKHLLPIRAIQNCGGIISCCHTSYSHVTSFSMALNKPCIVGAKFNYMPTDSNIVLMNVGENVIVKLVDDIHFPKSNNISTVWYENIAEKVCEQINSAPTKPLAHVLSLDNIDSYIDNISGLFFDSMIVQNSDMDIYNIENGIKDIHDTYPSLNIYYRFSSNILNNERSLQIQKEINFASSLIKLGIPINVFIANACNYLDIQHFKTFVNCKLGIKSSLKIGTMIECMEIVQDLDIILSKKMLDFAVVGINDLISSCLNLDRDDANNQKKFSLVNEQVYKTLYTINNKFTSKKIPVYIGYPKYSQFNSDYETLKKLGYKNYFGTSSLFTIAKKYGGCRKD